MDDIENSTTNGTDNDYSHDNGLYAEHICLIITALINIAANMVILITIYQMRSKSSVVRFICLLAASDMLTHLVTPPVYEILGNIHEIFQDFLVNYILTNLYNTGQICGVLVLLAMVLRNNCNFVETFHKFVIMGIVIVTVSLFAIVYFLEVDALLVFAAYGWLLLLLLTTTFVEHMVHIIHLEKPASAENKLSSVMAVIYNSFRIVFVLGLFVGWFFVGGTKGHITVAMILLTLVDLNAVVNIILLAYYDVNFKMRFCKMFRLNSFIKNDHVQFVNRREDNINILVDG